MPWLSILSIINCNIKETKKVWGKYKLSEQKLEIVFKLTLRGLNYINSFIGLTRLNLDIT